MRRLLARHEVILLAILLVALVGLGFLNDRFLTLDNLLNQGRLMTEIGLIALPMTFVIITGGIDLSVGAIVGLCAILLGYSWKNWGFPLPARDRLRAGRRRAGGLRQRPRHHAAEGAAADRHHRHAGALSRAGGGDQQGAFGARLSRKSSMVLARARRSACRRNFGCLGVCILIAGVALDRTAFGRTLYAVGANETAARFSALPVDRTKLIVYGLSGLMSGLSAWVLVSRVTTTRSDMGLGYELDVVAAVVLGGASIFGGSGTIWGTAIGLAMIQLLKNGLALTGVKGDATIVVIGVVLIASVLIASSLERRRE